MANLDRALASYTTALGLRVLRREGREAALGTADGQDVVVLREDPDARPAGRHGGLYHYALLYPSREELARAVLRLVRHAHAGGRRLDHETTRRSTSRTPTATASSSPPTGRARRGRRRWATPAGRSRSTSRTCSRRSRGEEPAAAGRPGLRVGHVHLHVATSSAACASTATCSASSVMALLPAPPSSPPAATTTTSASTPGRAPGRRPSPTASSASTTGRSCCPTAADVAPSARASRGPACRSRTAGTAPSSLRDPWSIPLLVTGRGGVREPGPQGPMVPREPPAAHPIDPGVRVGHVHLRTADIDRVRAFYVDLLGFDVVAEARDVPGWGTTGDLLFVSRRRLPPPPRLQHLEVGRRRRRSPTASPACTTSR